MLVTLLVITVMIALLTVIMVAMLGPVCWARYHLKSWL